MANGSRAVGEEALHRTELFLGFASAESILSIVPTRDSLAS